MLSRTNAAMAAKLIGLAAVFMCAASAANGAAPMQNHVLPLERRSKLEEAQEAEHEMEELEKQMGVEAVGPAISSTMPANKSSPIEIHNQMIATNRSSQTLVPVTQEVHITGYVPAQGKPQNTSVGNAERFAQQFAPLESLSPPANTSEGTKPVDTPTPAETLSLPALPPIDFVPKLGSLSTADLENEVQDLYKLSSMRESMGKEAFEATPFGGAVGRIAKIIDKEMMAKVVSAHCAEQKEMNKLASQLNNCDNTRKVMVAKAEKSKIKYFKLSRLHKTCRAGEAGLATLKKQCKEEVKDKKKIKILKCKEFALVSKKLTEQTANRKIVSKAGSEGAETYLKRISATFCGHPSGSSGKGGCGFTCKFLKAKKACVSAIKQYNAFVAKCSKADSGHKQKKKACNSIQNQMDGAACTRAIDMKDACESYSECYTSKKASYETSMKIAKKEEVDRRAEWVGLKRMQCLVKAFMDAKVSQLEIKTCKSKVHDTNHLVIKYPKLPKLKKCIVPLHYPSTPEYKLREFKPLPSLAKGQSDVNECTGVMEVSITPAKGSPKSCKCERVTANGPYTPGPLVKCTNCWDIRRTKDRISCPDGTKLFSPRTRADWRTFLKSASPLRAPNWVIDVTRPSNGCGGCTKIPMNSGSRAQKSWVTSDSSPWWLRSTKYNEPNGDYHANCYLDLWHNPKHADAVTFNDAKCNYHSKSYYCQPFLLSTTPKKGSPRGCMCKVVALTGKYSAGALLKCEGCLTVSKAAQKNSCPLKTKLFAPADREDWKTFLASAKPLRSPHWIIDITRPQNGCGGCTRFPMRSKQRAQMTWRTADAAPWWLRSTKYNEPNGDYTANCYLDLWRTPANENSVTFNDGRCFYRSNSYYCQPVKPKKR